MGVLPTTCLLVIVVCLGVPQHTVFGQQDFTLASSGDSFPINGAIDINRIGEGYPGVEVIREGALLCHTDDSTCCTGVLNPNGGGRGEWYLPGETVAIPPPTDAGANFYRSRTLMVLRLNRRNPVTTPTGVYRCEIPTTSGLVNKSIGIYDTATVDLCPNLVLANGVVTYDSAIIPGKVATHTCNSGYTLSGSVTRTCVASTGWDGSEPTCMPVTMEPTTMEPTTMEPTTMEPTTMEPTTMEPTTMEPTTMEPTTMGTNTMEPTTMEPTTMEPTTMEPTTMGTTTMEPTTMGPTTMGTTTMEPTTMESTTMGPTTMGPTTMEPTTMEPTTMGPTTMPPEIVCSDLPSLDNGMISYSAGSLDARPVGSMATHSCTTMGYSLVGDVVRTCQNGGTWNGTTPTCQAVDCETPPSITNGSPGTPTNTTFGGTVTYTCTSGYILSGSAMITCLATGSWSTLPSCIVPQVYLSLSGTNYLTSNSEIVISSIGEINEDALVCHTDLSSCCRASDTGGVAIGEWKFPDGTNVLGSFMAAPTDDYFRTRNEQLIRLHRRNNANSPTGLYCCVIPVDGGGMETFCANLVESITTTTPTLTTTMSPVSTCSDLPPPANGMVVYSSGPANARPVSSTVTYSCNNSYSLNGGSTRTCQNGGTWSGGEPTCEGVTTPPPPTVIVSPLSPSGTNTAGETYSLSCTATVDGSSATPTFIWLQDNVEVPSGQSDTRMIINGGESTSPYSSMLQFTALQQSHAGMYTCRVSVGGVNGSMSTTVTVGAPTITAEVVPPGDPQAAGQSYSLMCTVTGADSLNPTINFQWYQEQTAVGTNSLSLTFDPLVLSDAGQYSCEVMVTSTLLTGSLNATSGTVDIIIQVPPPTVIFTPPAPIFPGDSPVLNCMVQLDASVDEGVRVTVSWSGPIGAQFSVATSNEDLNAGVRSYTATTTVTTVVDGEYVCSATITPFSTSATASDTVSQMATINVVPAPSSPTSLLATPQTTSVTLSWTQTPADVVERYTITYTYQGVCTEIGQQPTTVTLNDGSRRNFEATNIQEFSDYSFTVTAANGAGSSPVASVMATTLPTAPSGPVQNLIVSSSNSSSVSLQWDRVNCMDRNSEITGYTVTFGPTIETVTGTGNRVFTATGLIPRTEYTFQVTPVSDSGMGTEDATFPQTTAISPDITLYLGGQLFSNHGLVDPADIGEDNSALLCLTNYISCCDGVNEEFGEWYNPDTSVVQVSSAGESLYSERGSSLVRLNRQLPVSMVISGIYRCEILAGAGLSEDVYVGLYPPGQGSPATNTDIVFDRADLSLTCTSTGGPASVVGWTRNGQLVGPSYTQSQTITNTMDSTYENVLRATDISDLVGEFSCTVTNVRGSSSRSILLNGISIEGDDSLPFTVGTAASITCVSDSVAAMIQWFDPSGVEVAMTITGQTLDLPFNPVSDSLHNSVYTCRVTRAEGAGQQSTTLTVTVPPNSISVTVSSPSSPVAGMDYTLRCEVTRLVSGLTNTPTAVWETNSAEEIVSGGDILDLPLTNLRTSDGGRYVCKGSLTSPALAVPQEEMDSAIIIVQIPTPGVSIAQPPSPLYAGTSLSLTCTITVNPAVDTTVSVAVTWERTRKSEPVTITTGVSTMGSRPTFTSTVTGITLSTLDTGFTCRAVVDPQAASVISSSPEGMDTQPIGILTPPRPVLSIVVSGSPVAGSMYGLNCTATNVPGPLTSLLTMVWRRASGANETTMGVYIPLAFSPLRTSDGDVYTCQAVFDIPEANLTVPSNSMDTTVNVQIPRPGISITGSPRDDGFSTGLELDLVCEVVLDAAVDSGLVVTRTWTKDGGTLSPEGSRLTLTEPTKVQVSPQVYQTNVSFNTLNAQAGDSGRYVCSVTIEPQDTTYIDGTTADINRDIAIEDFPVQQIDLPGDVTALAGTEHTLVCTATKNASLSTAVLEVEWLGPNGPLVNGQDGITITGEPSTMDNTLTSSLTFTNVVTSQGGMYTCSVNLTIPEANVTDHNVRHQSSFKVQIPPPLSVSVAYGRPVPHYEGTTLDLTCTITLNTTGVDTAVMVERQFSGTTGSEDSRVTLSPLEMVQDDFITTLTFYPVGSTDGGLYTCSVTVSSDLSVPNSQYISTSGPTEGSYDLAVTALPVPMVTITPSSLMIISGQSSTLTCTVAVEEYLVVVPAVQWMNSSGQEVGGVLTNIGTVTTSELAFTGLVTSQAGPYTCRGRINVPSVVGRDNSEQIVVIAQIPPPGVSITSSDQTAYHGTDHTLTCTIIIDPSVNTPVNVLVVWSIGETTIMDSDSNTIIQPALVSGSTYTADLTFTPLNRPAVSSGVYTCDVTVLPVNTTYIRHAIGSNDLTLEVLAAPPPVVTTDVPNRDGPCGGVTTFTCSGSMVDNFAVSPEVTWQDPSNQTVGNQEVLSVQNGGSRIAEGMYTCMACVTVPSVGISNLCSTTTIQIRYTAPDPVLGLTCPSLVSTDTLNITWSPPTDGGDVIVGYQVEVMRYVPGEERQVTTDDLTEPFNKEITPSSAEVTGLASTIRYLISVMGVSASGCGSKVTVECYTEEGVPQMIQGVEVVRLSDSEMNVSWVPLTIVEARGFLGNYSITYSRVSGTRRKRQAEMVVVSPDQSSVVIDGLEAGVDYGVTVTARNLNTGTTSPPSAVIQSGLPTPTSNVGVIVAIIIVVIVLVIVVVVAIIVIVYLVQKHKQKGKFKVSTQRAYELSDRNSSPIEPTAARPHSPFDNDFDQLENEKSKEAAAETDEVAPVATSAEVLDRMKPISLSSFRGHVQNMHDDRAKGFEAEYQSFSLDPLEPHDIAKVSYNRIKNRFANIFPFDHSRVTLKPVAGVEGSDYINACFINGYQRENCYIAAQGPMPNSMEDFWRMIWEYKLANVVMLTKCKEGGRVKCEQYWAEDIGSVFETENKSMAITTLSVVPFADFVIRQFTLKNNNEPDSETLKVTQFHFTAWPDHGVPKFATSLIAFIRKTQRGHLKDKGVPLLVHCSAGVGRTGTFITLDSMLERIHKETSVNVYEFVKLMRTRRVLMVQTLAQYTFIHDALGELITCGETDIPAGVLRTKVNLLSKVIPGKGITGFANQFQLLDQVSRVPEPEDVTDAVEHYNLDKNRYPDKIPYNMSRARLRPTGEDGSEYINASFVDGYKQRNAYIATQGPMKNTVNDLWRMIWEFKSKTLVMVCNMEEEGSESAFIYWPFKEGEMIKYGKINVTLQSKAAYGEFTVRKFMVHEERPAPAKQLDGFVVTQFHHTEWPSHGRPQTGTLIEMLDMITKSQMSTGNRPITVMCNDGVGRSGTFICIHAQLERLKTEGVVDFFQSIKSARIQRAGLVPDVAQYTFCHEVLADYIDKFDNYANFKDML